MIINIADSISSLLQSIALIYISNYCTKKIYQKNSKDLIAMVVILWAMIEITTGLVGNSSLGTIFIHFVMLTSIIIIFKNDPLGSMIGFGIVYISIAINLIICSNIYLGYLQYIFLDKYLELGMIIFMYLPQYIMAILILCNKKFIKKIYKVIRSRNISIVAIVIVTIVMDFLVSFNAIVHDRDNPLFKEFIFISFSIFIVLLTLYFFNIEKKSKEILNVNLALEEMNNELKKVKHDYGAQISYLYGLYLMGQYERLGSVLKGIINNNSNVASEIEIINGSDSVMEAIINGIEHKGINIILDDQIDFEDICISEVEFQRVISNILRNAVNVMNQNGVIQIKSYYSMNDVIIKIKNNGPKIREDIIDKIFDVGFSTKENSKRENGFGLSIVKEIIESANGTVGVSSDDDFTEFTINIPRL
ncbi:ATP-binding protein [Clostridium sp. 1001271B_151109_B4]|uniref:sensor histidine kinase n=1 Tax=Clostridium sp. 1001271B_151109_B4 TaxID=2787148 RepID=UPI00325FD942